MGDNAGYWDSIAAEYQEANRIRTDEFHYGPLVPGDFSLRLLPDGLFGLRCLELGCGAGQNSVFLASKGADCAAVDISPAQIEAGRAVAAAAGVAVDFMVGDMKSALSGGVDYDLIHSSYALAFHDDPEGVIAGCAEALKPDGTLLFSTGHPLHAWDWVADENGCSGVLVEDYFHPPADRRGDGGAASYYSVAEMFDWVCSAGLTVERYLEPQAVECQDIGSLSDWRDFPAPYVSLDWLSDYEAWRRIPLVSVFKCRKLRG